MSYIYTKGEFNDDRKKNTNELKLSRLDFVHV